MYFQQQLFLRAFTFLTAFLTVVVNVRAQTVDFNAGWKFHLGHAADAAQDFNYSIAKIFDKSGKAKGTCIAPGYADSNWQNITLPHDWAVALPFTKSTNKDVEAHGFKPIGGLYPQNSIGWYRKTFTISAADSGKRIAVKFDGIYRDSKVWVNGYYVGSHLSGYTGSLYDITDFINYNGENVIVVRADASQYEGWFYEGAGIYRNTWLIKQNNLHIQPNGVYIRSNISNKQAELAVETTFKNENNSTLNVTITNTLVDRTGKIVARVASQPIKLPPGNTHVNTGKITVTSPRLWNLTDPYLYRMITAVKSAGGVTDQVVTRYGIRSLVIDNIKGLLINGKSVKIKGVCCHQDHAGVGTAITSSLQFYRIGLLKEMGANAYRSSHHPPAPEVLDACDSLGLLVLDETRLLNSGPEYKNQFEELIRRDRNHPSVMMWSIGNEEEMAQDNSYGKRIAQSMVMLQQNLDPDRTCTFGANNGKQLSGVNEVIPVRGVNYFLNDIDTYRIKRPLQPVIGTEVGSTVTTRGVYTRDTLMAYLPDHDITHPSWATTAEKWWTWAAARTWFMGGFVWTGFDYRGEPTPFRWPNISSHFGIMDVCGFPKNNYYYYQAWWSDKDVLQVSPHWNHPGMEGKTIDVWVNSNAEQVELFLNGNSQGKKRMPLNGHLQWSVSYQPGRLSAVAYKNGRQWQTSLTTTGKAQKITILPNKIKLASGETGIINLIATDENGLPVADANDEVTFNIEGNARILGFGNGDPSSHESDTPLSGSNNQRHFFNGRCQLLIAAGDKGKINIKADAKGFVKQTLTIDIAK